MTQSTSFRLAMAFTGLIFVVMAATIAIGYLLSKKEFENIARDELVGHLQVARSVYKKGGQAALKSHILDHMPLMQHGGKLYSLQAPDGRVIAGNVKSLPAFVGWKTLPADQVEPVVRMTEDVDNFLIHGSRVGKNTLYIGQADITIEEIREVLLEVLLWSLLGAILLAFTGGLLLGVRAERRIASIGAVLDDVAMGLTDRRINTDGDNRDDLGRVAVAINAMLDRLSRLIESQKQISADIAHDLKTPITHLNQILEHAAAPRLSSEDRGEAVQNAVTVAANITETFEALLHIAQIEGSDRPSRMQILDLVEIGETVFELYQPVAEDRGHCLEFNAPAAGPIAFVADKELVMRMFANLLDNAIIHSPAPAKIAMTLYLESGHATAEISDTGPGIPESEREKVFRRLYRLEKSRTRPGHGLGLAVVAAIAQLHEAKIELGDNAPGLKIRIQFPIPETISVNPRLSDGGSCIP